MMMLSDEVRDKYYFHCRGKISTSRKTCKKHRVVKMEIPAIISSLLQAILTSCPSSARNDTARPKSINTTWEIFAIALAMLNLFLEISFLCYSVFLINPYAWNVIFAYNFFKQRRYIDANYLPKNKNICVLDRTQRS